MSVSPWQCRAPTWLAQGPGGPLVLRLAWAGTSGLQVPAQTSYVPEWGVWVSLHHPVRLSVLRLLQRWDLPSCPWEESACQHWLVLMAGLWVNGTVPLPGYTHGPRRPQVGKLAPGLSATLGTVFQQVLWLQGAFVRPMERRVSGRSLYPNF